MFSNTANNSASDKVNTRPRLKAYLGFITFLKNNQQKIALVVGYCLVALLFFNLGRLNHGQENEITIEQPPIEMTRLYNNLINDNVQLTSAPQDPQSQVAGETAPNCAGKIKGNISSSGKIYHLPGGAFYERTNPEICFGTESEAQAAGFRKSSK